LGETKARGIAVKNDLTCVLIWRRVGERKKNIKAFRKGDPFDDTWQFYREREPKGLGGRRRTQGKNPIISGSSSLPRGVTTKKKGAELPNQRRYTKNNINASHQEGGTQKGNKQLEEKKKGG